MIKVQSLKLKVQSFLNQKGFTLVELLVVVAIIGILSTLLTANFIAVRQRGRDSQRKSNLRQIQSALELYRADQAGYPTAGPNAGNFPTACGSAFTNVAGSTTYMQKVPCDPTNVPYTYSSTDTTRYTLIGCLENSNDSEKDLTNVAPCTGTTNFSFTFTNP